MNATLHWDALGQIACAEHLPYAGSDSRVLGAWRAISAHEACLFEHEVGRPPRCETCAAIARRAEEAR